MSAKPFDLTGRVALVTGGGRGIGAAIVRRLAEAGAGVVIANRTRDVADALAGELASTSHGFRMIASTLCATKFSICWTELTPSRESPHLSAWSRKVKGRSRCRVISQRESLAISTAIGLMSTP